MKRSLVVELIVALLILLFVYTATSKFFEFSSFRYVLSRSPLLGQSAPVVAFWVLIIEYVVSFLLFFQLTRQTALWASAALLLVSTGYTGYMLVFSFDNLPCSCGGVIKELSRKQHLVFNIFFTLLALAGTWLHRNHLRSMKTPQTVFSGSHVLQGIF